ncbi:MAG: DUF1501 domain-containing protein [Myxococcota bacterium]
MFRRRDLLKLGAAASVGWMGARSARAASPSDPRLVIVFAYGGWDPTYLFDPKPGSSLVDTPDGEVVEYGALPLWRPSGGNRTDVHDFLTAYADRMAVVNGVAVNSLVHETCAQKVLTGSVGLAHPPDLGARVADALGRDLPLPYLRTGAGARPQSLAAQSGVLGYSNQLASLVVPDFAYPSATVPYRPDAAASDAVSQYLDVAHSRFAKARPGDVQTVQDWRTSLDRAAAIRQHADQGGFLADPEGLYQTDPFEKAAAALAEGFSRAVFVQDDGYWDTHSANRLQRPLFHDLFAGLDRLMTALQTAGEADRTVVLVISEMGRSPLLNRLEGKDHWPFTSAMLIGPGVRSTLVDGSDEGLQQRPVDLKTGRPDAAGRALQAEDVLATTASLMGLDASALYPKAEVIRAVVA